MFRHLRPLLVAWPHVVFGDAGSLVLARLEVKQAAHTLAGDGQLMAKDVNL